MGETSQPPPASRLGDYAGWEVGAIFILALVIGGGSWGFIGFVLAIPLAGALWAVGRWLFLKIIRRTQTNASTLTRAADVPTPSPTSAANNYCSACGAPRVAGASF